MINVTPIAISATSQQYAVSITENLVACYDLALTDLKDKDRPYWIRKYFHVESKF